LPQGARCDADFLPNFCAADTLLRGIVLALALAAVLSLSPLGTPRQHWEDFSLTLVFILWIGISSMAVLCLIQRGLCRLRLAFAVLLSYLVVPIITWGFSELMWYVMIHSFDSHNEARQHYVFILRNVGISAIVSAVGMRYLYIAHQRRRQATASLRARLQALQARMHPHFLFNTLNTIASLTRFAPDKAESAVLDLAELVRATLSEARERIPLHEELALCQRYLAIEQLRLEERLQVEWSIALLPEDALVPVLALQTLLENAVRHGIQVLPEGGIISISGLCDGRTIQINIDNPLPATAAKPGHRIALDNLRERLHAYYGRDGYVDLKRDDKFRVVLRFPYTRAQ
jgi:two-component system, LytTR family, sensor histidine kinase AlgZ